VTATATLSGTLVDGAGPGALEALTFPIPVNTDPSGLSASATALATNSAFTGTFALRSMFGYYQSGMYYPVNGRMSTGTSSTLGVGTLRVTPWYVPAAMSITRLGAEVTSAGDAGSKFRLGIYTASATTGLPSTLLLDAGTINGDSATVQEITVAQALTAGLYWVGGVVQSVTTTQPTMRASGVVDNTPFALPFGSSIPAANQLVLGFSLAGVTGALPATFGAVSGAGGSAPRVFVKAA
jgi:hypothetical protein